MTHCKGVIFYGNKSRQHGENPRSRWLFLTASYITTDAPDNYF